MGAADALANVSTETLRAILNSRTASSTPKTPKLSVAIDAVEVDDVPAVVRACREGIAAKSVEPLNKVSPELAIACLTNSEYRGKDVPHSLGVCARRLEATHGPVEE